MMKYLLCIYFLNTIFICYSFHITTILSKHNNKIAAVYAGQTFHEEVTSSITCMLHDMGYYVIAYIYNGYFIGNIQIPFTDKRIYVSKAHYGNCVSEWIQINTDIPIYLYVSITVFITYPMKSKKDTLDEYAFTMLKEMNKLNIQSPIVLIAHRSNTFIWNIHDIEQYIPRNQTIYLFLSEHTYKNAINILLNSIQLKDGSIWEKGHLTNTSSNYHQVDLNIFNLKYLYPVLPLSYIMGQSKSIDAINNWKNALHNSAKSMTLFSIQGKFGGKHKTRKNPQRVLSCLSNIENRMIRYKNNKRSIRKNRNKRKLYNHTKIEQNSFIYKQVSSSISLDLIGQQLDYYMPLQELKNGRIRKLSYLNAFDFYLYIAHSLFLVAALNNQEYLTSQATSSIPAALISQVPIIATRDILDLYPCLKNAKIHKYINQLTECESIQNAMKLTIDQYQQAKDEIKYCANIYWELGKKTLLDII